MSVIFQNTMTNVSMKENYAAVQTVAAVDSDGGAVTFSVSGGADAALFNINANTGELSFNSAPDHDNPADANTDNVYEVEVTATSPTGSTAVVITVTVTDDDSVLEKNLDLTAKIAQDMAQAEHNIGQLQQNKADKTALQTLDAAFQSLEASYNARINDAPGSETDKVFSKDAINGLLSDLQTTMAQAINDKGVEIKDSLINGASAVMDTFKEVETLFDERGDIITALQDVAASKVSFSAIQDLTEEQMATARTNIRALDANVFEQFKTEALAYFSGIGSLANYDPLNHYNTEKAKAAVALAA